MKAPFPYFGGKSRAAALIWERFGDVPNYVEPFAGSLAVLLSRPHEPRVETVNDLDCYLANFWRALQHAPDEVARHADWPVNEADLHARHLWLVNSGAERVERLKSDPDFYDAKVAGWWVWGISQWIGSGWCSVAELRKDGNPRARLPMFSQSNGVHSVPSQMPYLASHGQGIHQPSRKLPHLGNGGRRVHRPDQKRPHLMSGKGVHRVSQQPPAIGGIYAYFDALAARLRRVRVCCGDWSRVLGPSVTEKIGITGILLDPPYADTAGRDGSLYAQESLSVAHDVREWAIANGDNPVLRIALCGYEGEHEMPESWECIAWKAPGGYASQNRSGNDNGTRERLWFSPHCLKPQRLQPTLFEVAS